MSEGGDNMFDFALLAEGMSAGTAPRAFGPDPVPWEPPPVMTASDWCDRPEPEHVSILGALITEGSRLVIGGDSGHGKTTLVMGIVHAVATSGEFLGMEGCGAPVLIIDLEQGERTMRRRLVEARLSRAKNVVIARAPDGIDLMSPEQYEWMRSLIEDAEDAGNPYRLVVIDPLYKAHTGDSNDERAMVDLMRKLDALRDSHGFGLVIPMHLRKGSGLTDKICMHDIFGSGGVVRGAEVVIGIQRREGNQSRLYFWKDRDGELEDQLDDQREWTLWFNREEGFFRAADDVKYEIPATEIIMDYMAGANHAVSQPMIIKNTALTRGRAENGFDVLVSRKKIVMLDERAGRNTRLYALPSNAILTTGDNGIDVQAIDDAIGG